MSQLPTPASWWSPQSRHGTGAALQLCCRSCCDGAAVLEATRSRVGERLGVVLRLSHCHAGRPGDYQRREVMGIRWSRGLERGGETPSRVPVMYIMSQSMDMGPAIGPLLANVVAQVMVQRSRRVRAITVARAATTRGHVAGSWPSRFDAVAMAPW